MCLLDDSVELTKDELKELFRINRNEDILKEYKYFCCMSSFENEGCKKSKHSETNSLINNKSNVFFLSKMDFLFVLKIVEIVILLLINLTWTHGKSLL